MEGSLKIRIENPLEDAETLVIDGKEFITEIGKRPKIIIKYMVSILV